MPGNAKEKSRADSRKAKIVLICGTSLAICWSWVLPDRWRIWWENCSFLPEKYYFPVEEFLALNVHHNSLYASIGGIIIATTGLIWAWQLSGRRKKPHEYCLLFVIAVFLLLMSLPCLCRPPEYVRRMRCRSELKEIYLLCEKYAEKHGNLFPDVIDQSGTKHPAIYRGSGKRRDDRPFVLLEDPQGVHAGDMRHRVWSNGEVEIFYPWKQQPRHDAASPGANLPDGGSGATK